MNKVPAILKSKKKVKSQCQKTELSHGDVQRLHDTLRRNLNDLNFFIRIAKLEIAEAWDNSIPGTKEGEAAYSRLNNLRNTLRGMQADEKKTIKIQRKLKNIMSFGE